MEFGFGNSLTLDMSFGFRKYAKAFHPTDLANTQLYFAKNVATPSLWIDQSPNGYDLSQAIAAQQPTISANSVDFDGINDEIFRTGTNFFSTDTLGTFYFSFYVTSGEIQRYVINNSTSTGLNNLFQISYSEDKIRLVIDGNIIITSTNTFTSGYLYGSISSNGSSYSMTINGITEVIIVVSGSNNGSWLSSLTSLNRISIGRVVNSTINVYGKNKVNKFYYNNTLLSASDITKLNTFFSDPNNY